MTWKMIQVIGLTVTFAATGCANSPMPAKPQKPELTRTEIPGTDLVCYDRDEAIKLGQYILELEAGYS